MATDDDDSSSCSSGDELLNYTVMSQPSPVKSEEKKDDAVQLASNAVAAAATADSKPSASQADNSKPSPIDEARALATANSVIIDKQFDSPSTSLRWHITKKKKKTTIFPVRIPPDESEYIGYKEVLEQKMKGSGNRVIVQYIQFPHVEIKSKDVGLYDAVPRSQLSPYHGDNENKDAWCPKLSEQYFKQLKQKHKLSMGDQQIRVEQLYLQRILEKAKEEEANRADLEQYNVLADEDDEYKIDEPNPDLTTQEDHDSDEDIDRRRSKRRRSYDDQNGEWLHVGDVIQLYKPATTAGLPENLRQATIMAIVPNEDPTLIVDCAGEMNLYIPNDHPIQRIKRMERGSLKDCIGNKYWPVDTFTLRREGSKDARSEVTKKRVAEVQGIMDRNKKLTMEKIEQDGCGPTDMLR